MNGLGLVCIGKLLTKRKLQKINRKMHYRGVEPHFVWFSWRTLIHHSGNWSNKIPHVLANVIHYLAAD
jgi:hypothetical protein